MLESSFNKNTCIFIKRTSQCRCFREVWRNFSEQSFGRKPTYDCFWSVNCAIYARIMVFSDQYYPLFWKILPSSTDKKFLWKVENFFPVNISWHIALTEPLNWDVCLIFRVSCQSFLRLQFVLCLHWYSSRQLNAES